MTWYNGTNGSDYVGTSGWNYSWDAFKMWAGNDTVYAADTSTNLFFYGMTGNDYFVGSHGRDTAYGDENNDTLYGRGNSDYLYGGSGSDHLYGGTGSDVLFGGTNGGTDYFHFAKGDSNAIRGQNDWIKDWNGSYDYIDSSIKGTSSNYAEQSTSATNMTSARSLVENNNNLNYKDHVFMYNSNTDTGYLFSDLDGDYKFETGVIIEGAGSSSDMTWSDIL